MKRIFNKKKKTERSDENVLGISGPTLSGSVDGVANHAKTITVNNTPEFFSKSSPVPPKTPKYLMKVRALADFEPDQEEDGINYLRMRQDDIIYVIEQDPSGWWEGELNGEVGVFPGSYTEVVFVFDSQEEEMDQFAAAAKIMISKPKDVKIEEPEDPEIDEELNTEENEQKKLSLASNEENISSLPPSSTPRSARDFEAPSLPSYVLSVAPSLTSPSVEQVSPTAQLTEGEKEKDIEVEYKKKYEELLQSFELSSHQVLLYKAKYEVSQTEVELCKRKIQTLQTLLSSEEQSSSTTGTEADCPASEHNHRNEISVQTKKNGRIEKNYHQLFEKIETLEEQLAVQEEEIQIQNDLIILYRKRVEELERNNSHSSGNHLNHHQ